MDYSPLFFSFLDGYFYACPNRVFVIPIFKGFLYIRFWWYDRCFSVSYVNFDDYSILVDSQVPAELFYKDSRKNESGLMDLIEFRSFLDSFDLDYKKLYLGRFDIPFETFQV